MTEEVSNDSYLVDPSHEVADSQEPTVDTDGATSANAEQEANSEAEATEEVNWKEKFEEESKRFEKESKRVSDNKRSYDKIQNNARGMISELVESGVLTQEDADLRIEGLNSSEESGGDLVNELVETFHKELPVAKSLLGISDEDSEKYAQAFNIAAQMDGTLINKWADLPEAERTKYVLDKGKSMLPVLALVEKEGSVIDSLVSYANNGAVDEASIRTKIEAELDAKYEEKYKDYYSASKEKPKLTKVDSNKVETVDNSTESYLI